MGHGALVPSLAWRPLFASHAPRHGLHLCGPAVVPKGVQQADRHCGMRRPLGGTSERRYRDLLRVRPLLRVRRGSNKRRRVGMESRVIYGR